MSIKNTKMNRKKALVMLGMVAAVAYAAPNMTSLGDAHASGGGSGGGFFGGFGGFGSGGGGNQPRGFGSGTGGFIINDQITATECSDCHMAYGPDALPSGSWKRMMGNLSNHFGEDASLDEQTRSHIENYLVSNTYAGDGPLRITEQPWFASEHRGEARLGRGQTWANCNACHRSRGAWR
ncbi:MAG: hypothetical protein COB59_00085 [Rhodospirillaceae bacterium]|nr:MAG: hypothetical protein COB59_00085 [Rhodospirillaceae bacterium]